MGGLIEGPTGRRRPDPRRTDGGGGQPTAPDGPDHLRRLPQRPRDCHILVVTGAQGARRLRQTLGSDTLRSLVRGMIDNDTTPHQLVRHIRDVARGQRVTDPRLLPALASPESPLIGRERDVLGLAALGIPAGEIATNLAVSSGTVRNYLSKIVRKTRARTLVEAVGIATRAGWL